MKRYAIMSSRPPSNCDPVQISLLSQYHGGHVGDKILCPKEHSDTFSCQSIKGECISVWFAVLQVYVNYLTLRALLNLESCPKKLLETIHSFLKLTDCTCMTWWKELEWRSMYTYWNEERNCLHLMFVWAKSVWQREITKPFDS